MHITILNIKPRNIHVKQFFVYCYINFISLTVRHEYHLKRLEFTFYDLLDACDQILLGTEDECLESLGHPGSIAVDYIDSACRYSIKIYPLF